MPLKVLVRISEFSDLTSQHSLSHRLLYIPCPALTLPSNSIGHTYVLVFFKLFLHGSFLLQILLWLVQLPFFCISSSVIFSIRFLKTSPEASALQNNAVSPKGSPPLFLIISRPVSRVRSPYTANKDIWSNIQKKITPNRKTTTTKKMQKQNKTKKTAPT